MIVTLWLTRKCNLKCTYCYEGEKQQQVMQRDIFEDALQFIKQFFVSSNDENLGITFHGGEPMLEYQKIQQCIEYFNKQLSIKDRVSYMLTTNGTLMTNEQAKFLANNVNVSISIDGNQDRHDMCRIFPDGKGTYELVVKNSKNLLQLNKNIRARMTVTKEKVNYLYEDFVAVTQIGFKYIDIILDLYMDEWTSEIYEDYFEQLKKVKRFVVNNREKISVGILRGGFTKKGICNGGKSTLSIDYNGDIYPCMLSVGYEKFKLGNIYQGIDLALIDQIKNIGSKNNPECEDCDMALHCEGNRCKIVNYIINQDYYKPTESMCITTHLKVDLQSV